MTDHKAVDGKAESVEAHKLDAEAVAEFLTANPDFFVGRDELLLKLTLPHQRGSSISLVERQIALLREQNLDYHDHLKGLSDNALENEKTFERMRRLVLSLIESRDLEQVVEAIRDSLAHDFDIELHSLILFHDKTLNLPVRVEPVEIATDALGADYCDGKITSGSISKQQLAFLFPEQEDQPDKVSSSAIIPLSYSLHDPACLGVLALGSQDAEHFTANMESLFLHYLGEVLSRVLAQHMP